MSLPTGDPKETARLTELLGRELGTNERGKPIFSWRWSEDMFWFAHDTGKKQIVETKIIIPMIGAPKETHDFQLAPPCAANTCDGGALGRLEYCLSCGQPLDHLSHTVYSIQQDVQPEYTRNRQVARADTWLIAKWQSPEELVIGGLIGHGMGWQGGHKPTQTALITAWNNLYPGVDFPSNGWRIPTNARLPRGPQDPTVPNMVDTQHFINQVREQTSMSFNARLLDVQNHETISDLKSSVHIADEMVDGFNAFLNPSPGARGRASGGGFVSFPWSKKDRV